MDGCEHVTDAIFDCVMLQQGEKDLDNQFFEFFTTLPRNEEGKQMESQNFTSGNVGSSFEMEINSLALMSQN